jgi:hypothetical protein
MKKADKMFQTAKRKRRKRSRGILTAAVPHLRMPFLLGCFPATQHNQWTYRLRIPSQRYVLQHLHCSFSSHCYDYVAKRFGIEASFAIGEKGTKSLWLAGINQWK